MNGDLTIPAITSLEPCRCKSSTAICGCISRGSGELDFLGLWEHECPHGHAFQPWDHSCIIHPGVLLNPPLPPKHRAILGAIMATVLGIWVAFIHPHLSSLLH